MITKEQLAKVLSKNGKQVVKDSIIAGLLKTMKKYDISENDSRIAMFLAQTAHESGGFKLLVEGLNMTAKRICEVWPTRFSSVESALPYANNPSRLANKVYSNRMGNGSESSGDGYKYRGRGLIQITGKDNYKAFANDQGLSLEEVILYLETDSGACESAGWYWNAKNLNPPSDQDNVEYVSIRINGGTIGLSDRIVLFKGFKDRLRILREEELVIPKPPSNTVPAPNNIILVYGGEPTF